MITREKIIEVLKDKPLTESELLRRLNPPRSLVELHTLLMQMREAGQVKFDIRRGLWRVA